MAVDLEIDPIKAGAPDLKKQQDELEKSIRAEVEKNFPQLPKEAQEAMIKSRLGIALSSGKPELTKIDLGIDAGRKIKDHLFE